MIWHSWQVSGDLPPVLMLDLAFAVVVTVTAAYQWTGLARYWYARGWTTALATILWLAWFYV